MGVHSGKIIWVTGAGTGIGEATALRLAADGATVVLTGRRREPLEGVAGRIRGAGGTAHVQPADLTKPAEVEAVVAWIRQELGRLDIMVNNAGVNVVEREWSRISPEGIEALIDGNLTAAFYCARAVLPLMREQGGGLLVHTASMAGRNIGGVSGPGYTAAKHGVVAMSHSLNMAECVNGIRSTVFCPGEVNTPILKQRPNPLSQEELDRMLQPAHCADLISYICGLPPQVCMNEVQFTPTWNRGYVAAQQRKL